MKCLVSAQFYARHFAKPNPVRKAGSRYSDAPTTGSSMFESA